MSATAQGCEDCNNTQDPISLDDIKDIPSNFLFKVKEGNVTNCFDIRPLYEYYEKSKKLENPLTRTPFSDETLDRFLKQVTSLNIAKDNKVIQKATEAAQTLEDREMLRQFLTHDVNCYERGSSDRRSRRHRRHQDPFVRREQTPSTSTTNIFLSPSVARLLGVDVEIRTTTTTFPPQTPTPERPFVSRFSEEPQTPTLRKTFVNPFIEEPRRPQRQTPDVQNNRGLNRDLIQQREMLLSSSRPGGSSGGGGFHSSNNDNNFYTPQNFQNPLPQTHMMQTPITQTQFVQNPFVQNPFHQTPLMQTPFFESHQFLQNPFTQTQFVQNPFVQYPQTQTQFSQTPFAQTPFERKQDEVEILQEVPFQFSNLEEQTQVPVAAQTSEGKKKKTNWLLIMILILLGGLFLALLFKKMG